jgi:ribose/xylose/arabinose/galactoside ABC-type transport system permease subunit
VDRQRIWVYVFAGVFVGLAGLLQFSRLGAGDPTVAEGLELEVIAAVVIGGASLSGGRGTILGTLIGALLMATLRSGCSQLGLNNWVQQMVTGASIVAAVSLDSWRVARSKSKH